MLGPRPDRCVSETVLHWTVLIKDFSVSACFCQLDVFFFPAWLLTLPVNGLMVVFLIKAWPPGSQGQNIYLQKIIRVDKFNKVYHTSTQIKCSFSQCNKLLCNITYLNEIICNSAVRLVAETPLAVMNSINYIQWSETHSYMKGGYYFNPCLLQRAKVTGEEYLPKSTSVGQDCNEFEIKKMKVQTEK